MLAVIVMGPLMEVVVSESAKKCAFHSNVLWSALIRAMPEAYQMDSKSLSQTPSALELKIVARKNKN